MTELVQNGTCTAHGRTWPMYERQAFSVDVVGTIDAQDAESAEQIASELRAVLDKYDVTVKVEPVSVFEMTPEDQAEKNALSEAALAKHFS